MKVLNNLQVSKMFNIFELVKELYLSICKSDKKEHPFIWSKNNQTGELLIYYPSCKYSDDVIKKLDILQLEKERH